jgi:hypothetical protein
MILMIGGLRILGAMCDSLHLPDNVLDTEEHSFNSLLSVLKWGRAIEEMEHCLQVFSIFFSTYHMHLLSGYGKIEFLFFDTT